MKKKDKLLDYYCIFFYFQTLTFNMDIEAARKATAEINEITMTSRFVNELICEYIPALVISTI